MTIEQQAEVLSKLNLILEDFQMLRDGEWMPDTKSCNTSIDNVTDIIFTIENG